MRLWQHRIKHESTVIGREALLAASSLAARWYILSSRSPDSAAPLTSPASFCLQGGNQIGDEGAAKLAEVLGELVNLETLWLVSDGGESTVERAHETMRMNQNRCLIVEGETRQREA